MEVKVPGDKDPDDVFINWWDGFFTIDKKSMKLRVEDERTREAGLETGAACTKFMGQPFPVTSEDDFVDIKRGLGDEKPTEWVFTFNRVSYI